MTNTTEVKRGEKGELLPAYGTYTDRTYPRRLEAKAVWGARLIAPDDLLHDRQNLVATDDDEKQRLIRWLNGPQRGNGAISKALAKSRDGRIGTSMSHLVDGRSMNSIMLYEDDEGFIVGSPQGSHGYVYVSGWLKR